MSNSRFCIQQRQKEQQQLRKLLIFSFASSTLLHGIVAYILPRRSFESPPAVKEPIEIIIVDQPKPKAESEPIPVEPPKPQVQTPPPPVKPPEAVKAEISPLPTKPPETVKAETPPPKPAPKTPKPAPKKILTSPTPAPSQPIVSAPVEELPQPSLDSSATAPNTSVTPTANSRNQDAPDLEMATNSAPPLPEVDSESAPEISCINNCKPEYPSALQGAEGTAGVKLTIDRNGDVIGAELATADSNSQVNRQALLAARQMQFSSPGDSVASVQVKINFTVEGSEYDRARRQQQERREQIKQQQETARQEQLEAEQKARQEQLERERQVIQQQQQETTSPPAPEAQPSPKPLPALAPETLDEERLRKFRERMENYRQE